MKTTVTVNEIGRMVLPKTVRELIGIVGRARLEIEVVGGVAQITPAPQKKTATRKAGGRLVYAGPISDGWDSGEAVSRMRARRLGQ